MVAVPLPVPASSGLPGDPAARLRDAPQSPALPDVWRADTLATGGLGCVPSTHAPLDAELPGGGWPLGALVELLLPDAGGVPLWPLLLPALAAHRAGSGAAAVVLVGSPGESEATLQPGLPALSAAGLGPERLLWVRGVAAAPRLWVAEQALRCADVAAVLAWLPQARPAELRRLQLAAARQGDGLLFVLRPARAARAASPAPLRLRLGVDATGDALVVDIVKRRGPTLAAPLRLPAQSPAVRALLAAGAARRSLRPRWQGAQVLPFAARSGGAEPGGAAPCEVVHAVDRVAVAA